MLFPVLKTFQISHRKDLLNSVAETSIDIGMITVALKNCRWEMMSESTRRTLNEISSKQIWSSTKYM